MCNRHNFLRNLKNIVFYFQILVLLLHMQHNVLILDFGSQYTQLIARRVRELNIFCEIFPFNHFPTDCTALIDEEETGSLTSLVVTLHQEIIFASLNFYSIANPLFINKLVLHIFDFFRLTFSHFWKK